MLYITGLYNIALHENGLTLITIMRQKMNCTALR